MVAFAPSFPVLLGGRVAQALGAGGFLPVASAVIADHYPADRRGRMLGLIGAVFGIAFILGPVLGALLLTWSWRWLFVINLPLVVLLMFSTVRAMPRGSALTRRRVDWIGAAALAVALLSLALVLSGAGSLVIGTRWGQVAAVVLLLVATVSAALFVRVEQRIEHPILSPLLMRDSRMRAISALALATGFVEATMVFLPTLAVIAFAVDARSASMMMLPLVAALIVGSVVAGRLLDRVGPARVIFGGMILIVAGLAILALQEPTAVSFYSGALAVGFGLASLLGAPLRFVVLKISGDNQRAAGQGVLTVFLGVGRLAGAALIGGIVPAGDVESDGFRTAMLVVAGMCALSLIAIRWLRGQQGAAHTGNSG